MRCPICLESDALDILDEIKIEGKRIPVYICTIMGCEATGTRRELETASQQIIDNRYAYFFCECLQIGLFYRSGYSFHHKNEFLSTYRVNVPRLGIAVDIKYMGLATEGLRQLDKQDKQTVTIFPVNLWKDNRTLSPKPSRTVTQLMFREWSLIATAWERNLTT